MEMNYLKNLKRNGKKFERICFEKDQFIAGIKYVERGDNFSYFGKKRKFFIDNISAQCDANFILQGKYQNPD
jgi:hypothetical protein